MATPERPKKLQRISQACDLCHRRSIKCRPSAENAQKQCQNCYDFQVECTYLRPSRRKRNQSLSATSPPNILPSQKMAGGQQQDLANGVYSSLEGAVGKTGKGIPDYTGSYAIVREGQTEGFPGVAWRSFALSSTETIENFLTIYLNVVYPIFPLFHAPTLWAKMKDHAYFADRGMFASIMAACALASARARDGAIDGMQYQGCDTPERQSEIFFSAAQDAILEDLTKARGLGYIRACALLALTAIQYGQPSVMHQYMGQYSTLAAIQNFHDERLWPSDISVIEREERRRLFWSMYNFDVFISLTFGSMLRFQEDNANVGYPSEVNDEDLSADVASPTDETNWMRGWNFTTDLHRVLEHTLRRVRRNRQRQEDRTSVVKLLLSNGPGNPPVWNNVEYLYSLLPVQFTQYEAPTTGDTKRDIYGFQAANIQAAMQLVRMTIFTAENNFGGDVTQKCDLAEKVIRVFRSISPSFLNAISTPLVYHLGAVGNILATAMEGVLTQASFNRARNLLESMAELLSNLESGLQSTAGAAKEIREQINKIDQYMKTQRQVIPSMPAGDAMMANAASTGGTMMPIRNMISGPQASGPSEGYMPMHDEFFQLPPDLVGEHWPWPFDYNHLMLSQFEYGFFEGSPKQLWMEP